MKWAPIPGWETRYVISEYGDMRSLDMTVGAKGGKTATRKGRRLIQVCKTNGYLAITLTNGVSRPQVSIHRLVARAFIGECPIGLHVLHIDGDKTNNHFSNLRYGTPAENVLDTARHGKQRKGAQHPMAKLDVDAVIHIRSSCRDIASLALMYGVTREHVWGVRARRCWKHIA